jgi:hypothetical protein
MVAAQMFFKAYYFLSLILLAGAIGCAWITVSKLQNASATSNVPLLHFAYSSLSALILGALQHEILLASLLSSSPSGFFLDTGQWLGLTQNALWAIAILSVEPKQILPISHTPTFSKTFTIVIAFALLTYPTAALTSEMIAYLDAVSAAVIFMIFANSIRQWRLSKKFRAVFLIHGYSQLIWSSLWFNPLASWVPYTILLAFPPWRIVLLFAWIKLIAAMQSTQLEAVGDSERLALPNAADME